MLLTLATTSDRGPIIFIYATAWENEKHIEKLSLFLWKRRSKTYIKTQFISLKKNIWYTCLKCVLLAYIVCIILWKSYWTVADPVRYALWPTFKHIGIYAFHCQPMLYAGPITKIVFWSKLPLTIWYYVGYMWSVPGELVNTVVVRDP